MKMMPPAFSWESQAVQYAYRDEPGIHLERHHMGVLGDWTQIDCLLYRDQDGLLIGILNHYVDGNNPLEQAGNVNVWTKPSHQRRGIATELVLDAVERWNVDFEQQRWTPEGRVWITALVAKLTSSLQLDSSGCEIS